MAATASLALENTAPLARSRTHARALLNRPPRESSPAPASFSAVQSCKGIGVSERAPAREPRAASNSIVRNPPLTSLSAVAGKSRGGRVTSSAARDRDRLRDALPASTIDCTSTTRFAPLIGARASRSVRRSTERRQRTTVGSAYTDERLAASAAAGASTFSQPSGRAAARAAERAAASAVGGGGGGGVRAAARVDASSEARDVVVSGDSGRCPLPGDFGAGGSGDVCELEE